MSTCRRSVLASEIFRQKPPPRRDIRKRTNRSPFGFSGSEDTLRTFGKSIRDLCCMMRSSIRLILTLNDTPFERLCLQKLTSFAWRHSYSEDFQSFVKYGLIKLFSRPIVGRRRCIQISMGGHGTKYWHRGSSQAVNPKHAQLASSFDWQRGLPQIAAEIHYCSGTDHYIKHLW